MSQSQYPSSFDYEALLASGRGELFGNGNARLPAPPMLMLDRIVTINADGGAHGTHTSGSIAGNALAGGEQGQFDGTAPAAK